MKECIQCGKSFKAIKETAKYCSTSCRVMWNRKQPKKNKVEPFQMQLLYNSIMDLIKNNKPVFLTSDPIYTLPAMSGEIKKVLPKIYRSFEYYQQARIDCSTREEWEELKDQILNSELPQKQKVLLTT